MRLLWLTVLLLGCHEPAGAPEPSREVGPCDVATSPAIVPLSGLSPHPPVEDGAVLSVVRGQQGGFHTYLSLGASGLEPGSDSLEAGLRAADLPVTRWRLISADGLVTVEQEHWTVAEPDGDDWVTGPHLVVMQYYESPPAEGFDRDAREVALEAEDLRLEVDVTDVCGREASAMRTVRIRFAEPAGASDTGR